MEKVRVQDAVGLILCHDMTQIIKDKFKGPRFKKGHIIQEEDIPVLLSMGKEHIYIWKNDPTLLHEDEGAEVLYALCKNQHMYTKEIREGKAEIFSDCNGLLKVDREKLKAINHLGDMMIATVHSNFPVRKDDKIAAMRVIPLAIEKEKMEKAKEVAGNQPILSILPFQKKKTVIITTGTEVYDGLIQDAFGPVLEEKLSEYDISIEKQIFVPDDENKLKTALLSALEEGAEMILCTGGMSVDPDDITPSVIQRIGADVISYGAPVLPGAMFLLAYYNGVPIMGLPGCVMYAGRTIFDLILPRILADDTITRKDLSVLGEGGLCLNCPTCTFPNCGFGKGK